MNSTPQKLQNFNQKLRTLQMFFNDKGSHHIKMRLINKCYSFLKNFDLGQSSRKCFVKVKSIAIIKICLQRTIFSTIENRELLMRNKTAHMIASS